jgi:hypothetical protein
MLKNIDLPQMLLSIYGSTVLCLTLAAYAIFLDGDQPITRPLPTLRLIQTSVLRLGFEPTIPAFERAKTVRALDA